MYKQQDDEKKKESSDFVFVTHVDILFYCDNFSCIFLSPFRSILFFFGILPVTSNNEYINIYNL